MYSIYLKEHNRTALKYLGFTKQDPHEYRGSGKYWKSHCSKYGWDISTTVLFQSADKSEIERQGKYYSDLWDVVESADYANLMREEGQGGENSGSFKKGRTPHNKGLLDPEASKRKTKYWEDWKKTNVSKRDIYVGHWSPHPRIDNTTDLNSKNLQCPHCGKVTNVGNSKRWHFDKCKAKH